MNNGYGYNSYHYNNYNSPYMRPKSNSLSTASMIFGILSMVGTSVGYAGIVFGIVAIVLSLMARKETGRFESSATVGMALGILGLVISTLIVISLFTISEEIFDEYIRKYFEEFGITPEDSNPGSTPDL